MTLEVLKLRISGGAGDYKVSARIGDREAECDLGELPANLKEQLKTLQDSILLTTEGLREESTSTRTKPENTPNLPTEIDAPASPTVGGSVANLFAGAVAGGDIRSIRNIGSRLFNSLFQQGVYTLYQNAIDEAYKQKKSLPIKLYVETPDLAYIPWEALYDRQGLFHLCCYGTTPFARTATVTDSDLFIYDEPPIRILGMISAPKSFAGTPQELNTDAEQTALDRALKPLTDNNQVRLCWTAAGTSRELTRRIMRGDNGKPWDVLHFIGHGLPGNIVVEENGGPGYEFLSAEVLKGILSDPMGPKLVILNSCRGAQNDTVDRFASTAEYLVRGGAIAAVVAMQFDISDRMAVAFSPIFFDNLMTPNVPIQKAMTYTRLELQRRGFTEWISPVLYMQNKDGRVIGPASPPAPQRQ
jgi:CHAT domain-containing protein